MSVALASSGFAMVPAAVAAAAAAAATARKPRVAVIGAGYAGLAAALTLQRSGCCEVVVLEASSRAGGRACTQLLPGGLAIELGATWFHGLGDAAEPHPVFRHAVEQGLIGASPKGTFVGE
jgi:phytoene dehydrogenase-like protein